MWDHKNFSTSDFPAILQMTQEQYGPENDISNQIFLQHQYFCNPIGDALIDLAVDKESGQLAGQYIVWPMKFQAYGMTIKCCNSLNTLTGKAYRGQGIFTGLAEITYHRAAELDYKFCYGAPNPNSYPGFIKKLHFRELGKMPLMLRPLVPSQMVEEFFHNKVLANLAKPTNILFHLKKIQDVSDVEVLPVNSDRVDLLDDFWKEIQGKYPIMNIRNAEFVKYRYLDMPCRTYFPYIALQNGKPVCFAVGRIMEVAGMQCAMLADFLFVNGYEQAAKQLLKNLLCYLQEKGASLAGSLMFEHTHESILLKKLGFVRCPKKLEPQPFPLILRVFDKELEDKGIYDVKKWFFTMGDYDVI